MAGFFNRALALIAAAGILTPMSALGQSDRWTTPPNSGGDYRSSRLAEELDRFTGRLVIGAHGDRHNDLGYENFGLSFSALYMKDQNEPGVYWITLSNEPPLASRCAEVIWLIDGQTTRTRITDYTTNDNFDGTTTEFIYIDTTREHLRRLVSAIRAPEYSVCGLEDGLTDPDLITLAALLKRTAP